MEEKITDYMRNKEGNKFKQTEIGLIPEEWEVVKLGGYLELLRNGTTKKQNKDGLGYPITRIETIADARIDSERVGYINNFSKSEVERYLMEIEDILLSHINSEPHLGKTAIYEGFPPTLIHGMNLLLIRAKRCFLNSYFLNFLFNFYRLKGIFINLASRAVGQSSINQGKIKALQIPLPPLPEQEKIARVLSKIQQAIEQQDKIIEATKNLKKSLMQKLFTEGIINGFMFDTVIFNKILDVEISLDSLPKNFKYVVTHIQYDELNKTPNEDRRKKLLDIFFKIYSKEISTESTLLGTSILGKSKLSNNSLCEKIKLMLDRKQNKESNKNDALIAETAIKNGLILVTNDRDLAEVTQKYEGEAINLEDFLSENYRKLKETEIGKIPESWEVVKLKDIAELIRGVSWRKQESNKEGIGLPVISIPNVGINTLNFNFRHFLTKKVSIHKLLKKGDIIFVGSSGSINNVGRNTLINDLPLNKISFASFLSLIRVKQNRIISKFLYYLVNSGWIDFKKYTKRAADGKYNFQLRDFQNNTLIILPSLSEQRQITHILSTIDKKIELEESRKSILKELFKTMLYKLMTGEIRLKDINI